MSAALAFELPSRLEATEPPPERDEVRLLAAEHPALRIYAFDPGDMRTKMHQDAFPGEDISDRPEPAESVPGLLALIEGEHASGRYRASELAGAVA